MCERGGGAKCYCIQRWVSLPNPVGIVPLLVWPSREVQHSSHVHFWNTICEKSVLSAQIFRCLDTFWAHH